MDAVKHENGNKIMKSRHVAQNYWDKSANFIPAKDPTISNLRLWVAPQVAAMQLDTLAFTQFVEEAHTQSV